MHSCQCQLPHFQAVTLNFGGNEPNDPFFPNNKALIYPTDEPMLTKRRSVCLSSLKDFIKWNLRFPLINVQYSSEASLYGFICLSHFTILPLLPPIRWHTDRPLSTHTHTHTDMSQQWYARHAYATQRMISIHSVG